MPLFCSAHIVAATDSDGARGTGRKETPITSAAVIWPPPPPHRHRCHRHSLHAPKNYPNPRTNRLLQRPNFYTYGKSQRKITYRFLPAIIKVKWCWGLSGAFPKLPREATQLVVSACRAGRVVLAYSHSRGVQWCFA